MKKTKLYSKLPGVTYNSLGSDTVWAGLDHLLLMRSNGMSENYRRFYYKDILGIVITRTRKAYVILLLILAFTLITGGFTYALWQNGQTSASLSIGIMFLVFFTFLLGLLIKGSSCQCCIITAVQKENIPAVQYLKQALAMMAILKPLITKAQGVLAPDDVEKALANPSFNQSFLKKPPSVTDIVKTSGTAYHMALFTNLVLYAILVGLSLPHRTYPLVITGFIVLLFAGVSGAGALVSQRKTDLGRSLKILAWAGLGLVIFAFIQCNIEMAWHVFLKAFKGGADPVDQLAMFRLYCSIRPLDHPFVLFLEILVICVSAGLGLSGFFLLKKQKVSPHEKS